MRSDAPAGSVSPGGAGPQDTSAEPEKHAGDPAAAPDTDPHRSDPSPEPTATGEIHAQSQTEQVNEELQVENAETSLDQPSDGSGGE